MPACAIDMQLTIKISKKMERRFGVILAPLSSKECIRKDNLHTESKGVKKNKLN